MKVLILITTTLLITLSAIAKEITGKVISVADGDTITILDLSQTQHKIRFYGIDCPEKKQDFGQKAKQYLSKLIFGKEVKVKVTDTDRYGRSIGKVYWGKDYINLIMIQAGLAWHYKQYSKDKDLSEAETQARAQKIGLWSQPSPIPPWNYRRGVERQPKDNGNNDKISSGYWISASGKRHNSSCRYYKNCKGRAGKKSEGVACKICGG